MGFGTLECGQWTLWKYVEEPEFGPGSPVQTVFILGKLVLEVEHLPGLIKPTLANSVYSLYHIITTPYMNAANVGNIYSELCKWMSIQSCLNWLLEVKPSSDRVGPLVVVGLLNDSKPSAKWKVPPTLRCQVCFLCIMIECILPDGANIIHKLVRQECRIILSMNGH